MCPVPPSGRRPLCRRRGSSRMKKQGSSSWRRRGSPSPQFMWHNAVSFSSVIGLLTDMRSLPSWCRCTIADFAKGEDRKRHQDEGKFLICLRMELGI
ncbi:hypothetical protein SORBI_3003G429500 [Sorghum bicolor]|uniref:Uncharacterized protein n=1 Tax=Sorghum bicolor TaxID=4558 RepID=C5XIG4_SORBI|nr:hypothetical protein SORBI_3003G429500 [Sorghum bicolor]